MIKSSLFLKSSMVIDVIGDLTLVDNEITVSTDSRNINSKEAFVALKGEKFDGFDYVDHLFIANKCPQIIVYNDNEKNNLKAQNIQNDLIDSQIVWIRVSDATRYIQDLAHFHLNFWRQEKKINSIKSRVFAITGSNGKTTTKEMLAHLLVNCFGEKVHFTSGNLNNHVGVPLTIFKIEKKHEIVILEIGTNHSGEIKRLCEIIEPDGGIITNIGESHLEFFKTKENVFKEKRTLFDFVYNKSTCPSFILNIDDDFLQNLDDKNYEGLITIGKGEGNGNNVFVKYSYEKFKMELVHKYNCQAKCYCVTKCNNAKKVIIANNNISGVHNFLNFAYAYLLCIQNFPEHSETFSRFIPTFAPKKNRSQWIIDKDCDNSGKTKKIFLDAYNANPSSMIASLDAFIESVENLSTTLFVLGDMNELGEFAKKLHSEVGKHLKTIGARNIIFVGRYREYYIEGIEIDNSSLNIKSFESLDQLKLEWNKIYNSFDFFFVKGSRTLQLESLFVIS